MTYVSLISRTVLVAGLGIGGAMHAQDAPHYRLVRGDTLRYTERTDARIQIETPQATVDLTSEHVATIGVTLGAPDSAHAWYESLVLRQDGPGPQRQAPNTESVLRRPFILSISSRGMVHVRAVPQFPPEIASLTDLTRQFDDFFLTLPTRPLLPGLAWTDTLSSSRPTRPQDTFSSRHIRSYRVERDTVMYGARAVVIRVDQQLRMEASSPMEGQSATVHTALEGTEHGIAVFDPALGRLLARSRTGMLKGKYSMAAGSTRTDMPQKYEYTSTLSLAP
jgi:hypothetical protein